jgi:hypothetical protein
MEQIPHKIFDVRNKKSICRFRTFRQAVEEVTRGGVVTVTVVAEGRAPGYQSRGIS